MKKKEVITAEDWKFLTQEEPDRAIEELFLFARNALNEDPNNNLLVTVLKTKGLDFKGSIATIRSALKSFPIESLVAVLDTIPSALKSEISPENVELLNSLVLNAAHELLGKKDLLLRKELNLLNKTFEANENTISRYNAYIKKYKKPAGYVMTYRDYIIS